MAQGKQQLNLKEIHVIGSEIINAADGRTTDDGWTEPTTDEFRFHELY